MNTLLYIDPGLGSLIFQAVIGAVAAVGGASYLFRQKIAKWFGRDSIKDDAIEETEEEQKELSDN